MAQYSLLDMTIQSAVHKMAEECGMLLGQELQASLINSSPDIDREVYFSGVEEVIVITPVIVSGACEGMMYIIQSSRDAILLGSTLLGIPPGRIKEKRNLAIFSDEDRDAYAEVANQFGGSFNTVFSQKLGQKLHLKTAANVSFNPETEQLTDSAPIDPGDYFLARFELHLKPHQIDRYEVLVPSLLAAQLDPEGAQSEIPESETAPEASVSTGQSTLSAADASPPAQQPATRVSADSKVILLVSDDQAMVDRLAAVIATAGYQAVVARPDEDLLSAHPDNIAAALICLEQPDERGQSLCARTVLACRGAAVLASAPSWTRRQVLAALSGGVRDILVEPFPDAMLVSKLQRQVG